MPTLISFRDKTKSWQNYRVKFEFNNGNNYLKSFKKDPMMKKFLRNECLRMSCYSCAFKSYVRDSDFTLADFWGINLVAKRLNDNQGTSLILLNTPKAVQIFEKIKDNFYFKKVNFKKAIKFNPAIIKSVKIAKNREKIMKNIKNIKFK